MLVTLTVFPWVQEGSKRRETSCLLFSHFIKWPSPQGLSPQMTVSLAESMGVN